jgi:DNA-binding response OmpR family regulator
MAIEHTPQSRRAVQSANEIMTASDSDPLHHTLVVATDPWFADIIRPIVEAEGAAMTWAPTTAQAVRAIIVLSPRLILIEARRHGPRRPGRWVNWLRAVRREAPTTAVVVVFRCSGNDGPALALELGANLYLTLLAEPTPFLANLRSFLQVADIPPGDSGWCRVSDVLVHLSSSTIRHGDRLVRLPSSQFAAYMLLLERCGTVVPLADLAARAGITGAGAAARIGEVIRDLRRRLGDSDLTSPRIRAIPSVGYSLLAGRDQASKAARVEYDRAS